MTKYEIRFGNEKNHPSFAVADSEEEAIDIAIKRHNELSKRKMTPKDVALVKPTHKVPLESVATPFTKQPPRRSHVSIKYIEDNLNLVREYGRLILEPDFQRAHVWTEEQQVAYLEFLLRGGKSGLDIYFNAPEWRRGDQAPDTVLVDGLQRLTAVRKFMRGDLEVFGGYTVDDFEYVIDVDLIFHTNNLETREEILKWYLEMNRGGTPHTEEELNKVVKLLEKEKKK